MKKLIVLLPLLLVGCHRIDLEVKSEQGIGIGGSIRVVVLEDGTRCAVYHDGYAGGLSCDWNRRIR